MRNERCLILEIPVNSVDIREECQLFRMNRLRDRIGRIICIDVVCIIVIIQSDRADDRKKILLQKIKENVCIDGFDITYKPDIFTVGIFLLHLQKRPVFSADSDCTNAQFLYHSHQILIHFIQDHLRNFHGIFIRHAESVDKFRFHADLSDPAADLFSSAVDNDRFESGQFQQSNVFDHVLLQFFINHGTATIFYNNNFTVKTLDIWQRLDQHLCLVQIFLHILVHDSFLRLNCSVFSFCNLR